MDELAGGLEFVISSIAEVELIQGAHQGDPVRSAKRKVFTEEILATTPVLPFAETTARKAGQLRGEQAAIGNMLPFADSLIAAAALELNYSVITTNLKDFTRIPGLNVIPFVL